MRVLNVGGGSRDLPLMFTGWSQDLLDIDPEVRGVDIVGDSRKIHTFVGADKYDAVYCSHSLEHVYAHEVSAVLRGFHWALKDRGFVYLAVPDIGALVQSLARSDIDQTWYMAPGDQPISFHDVLYGWGKMVAQGNHYMAHKCGFTQSTLDKALKQFFPITHIARDGYNLSAVAIKCH